MWTYIQATGELHDPNGLVAGEGYSGKGDGCNNPAMQEVHNVGPIPMGIYDMQQPVDSHVHGPFAIPLTPRPGNEMYGRSGFMCHGDSMTAPGTASEGCVIMARVVRVSMWASSDHVLQVI